MGNLTDRPPCYNATPAIFEGFTGFLSTSCDLSGRCGNQLRKQYSHELPIPGFNWQVRYMSSFDKREEGFEKKFAVDEEQKFKAIARRNKLLGLWAADKLGLTGDTAASYAKEVVAADFEVSGDSDVLGKVARDLADKGVSEQQIRVKMDELMAAAVVQVKAGT